MNEQYLTYEETFSKLLHSYVQLLQNYSKETWFEENRLVFRAAQTRVSSHAQLLNDKLATFVYVELCARRVNTRLYKLNPKQNS